MPGDRPAGDLRGTRSPAVGVNGMIATSQTLASAAGLKVLQDGGNAIDAAVTAAGVLAVVEPSMNGIGGDLLALVWDAASRRVHGLDATGRSAYAATPGRLRRPRHRVDARRRPARRRRAGRRRGMVAAAHALRHDDRWQQRCSPRSATRAAASPLPRSLLRTGPIRRRGSRGIRRRRRRSCPTVARRTTASASPIRGSRTASN